MSKGKVLITGGSGQLGSDIQKVFSSLGYQVYSFTKAELDVSNFDLVKNIIHKIQPDLIIHSAAYTKVDLAEDEQDLAYSVNAFGARNVAIVSEMIGSKLVYISTDYVFDGEKNSKYIEFDLPNPQNVYGKSKYVGEQMIRDFHSRFFIVRTSWLYGESGKNFVKTMLKLAEENKQISIVHDQIGSPTYTLDLAEKISEIIQSERYGIYHITNSGECSWYEFAKRVFTIAKKDVSITPILTTDFGQKAQRPKYSVLDNMALRLNGFTEMRHWSEALKEFLM